MSFELVTIDQIQACEWRIALKCTKCGDTFCTNQEGTYRDAIEAVREEHRWCSACEGITQERKP